MRLNPRAVDIALFVLAVLMIAFAWVTNSAIACSAVLVVPFLFIVWRMMYSIWAAGTGRDPRLTSARPRPTCCERCGYTLIGLPATAEVCPECGQPIHPTQRRMLDRLRASQSEGER